MAMTSTRLLVYFALGLGVGAVFQHERDSFRIGYFQRANATAGREAGRLLDALAGLQKELRKCQKELR